MLAFQFNNLLLHDRRQLQLTRRWSGRGITQALFAVGLIPLHPLMNGLTIQAELLSDERQAVLLLLIQSNGQSPHLHRMGAMMAAARKPPRGLGGMRLLLVRRTLWGLLTVIWLVHGEHSFLECHPISSGNRPYDLVVRIPLSLLVFLVVENSSRFSCR